MREGEVSLRLTSFHSTFIFSPVKSIVQEIPCKWQLLLPVPEDKSSFIRTSHLTPCPKLIFCNAFFAGGLIFPAYLKKFTLGLEIYPSR